MARLSPAAIILVIVILLLLYSPGSSPSTSNSKAPARNHGLREQDALAVLQNSTSTDFTVVYHLDNQTLPIPGFRSEDGFNWQVLPLITEKVASQMTTATMGDAILINAGAAPNSTVLLYQNVTGWARGGWIKVDPHEIVKLGQTAEAPMNFSSVMARVEKSGRPLTHNITGQSGKLHLKLAEHSREQVVDIDSNYNVVNVRLEVQDESSYADGWTWRLQGVHHRGSGSMLLSTTSEQ